MGNEHEILIKLWFFVLPSLCHCYFIVPKLPKGKLRLFSLLPIFYLFTILLLYLSSIFPIGLTALFLTWLANFKLLLFAFDQGPLSLHPPQSLPLFIFITCLPIKINQNKTNPSRKTQTSPQISSSIDRKRPLLALIWPAKVLLYAILLGLSYNNNNVHPKIKLILYCCMVYLLIDIIFGVCNLIVHSITGFELDPPSDQPYFSTSLQDFWGRRWNLMVTNILRHTVYKPTRSSLETVLSFRWAPLPAVMAAFVVSGLMHELIFYYVTRARPTWEVTCFFVLHGACLVAEFVLKRLLTGKYRLHWAVSGPLTVVFVVVTATWLFFPPLVRTGVDVKVLEECKILMDFMKDEITLVLEYFLF